MKREELRHIIKEVIAEMYDHSIPVGISNRHIHLCEDDFKILFPNMKELSKKSDLKQPGEFASNQILTISGPKGSIEKVRVLGPLRKFSQVEVSATDARQLGVKPPIVLSGHLDQAVPITLTSEFGTITKPICIIAKRHIHMSPQEAVGLGVADGDVVQVRLDTDGRETIYGDVIVRAVNGFVLEMHIDTDEANAANVQPSTVAKIVR